MWEALLDWCAGLFGLTVRDRRAGLILSCGALFILGLTLSQRVGLKGWILPGIVLAGAAFAAFEVTSARNTMRRAAQLHLDDPRQLPHPVDPEAKLGLTATALHRLATAVDDVRRARYAAANEALPSINRDLLRPEDARLLEAVRAMISLSLGDTRTAAQLAALAIPTGSDELDTCLGRVLIAEAWQEPAQLRVIQADWDSKGIDPDHDGTLARLHRLTRLRIDERLLDGVGVIEARALSTEARAVGDESLAADLESRARESAYR